MAKITTQGVAFVLETLAHLGPGKCPEIKQCVGSLLLAAQIVRNTNDENLAKAVDQVVMSHYLPKPRRRTR